jgi:hypothetical protein
VATNGRCDLGRQTIAETKAPLGDGGQDDGCRIGLTVYPPPAISIDGLATTAVWSAAGETTTKVSRHRPVQPDMRNA